MWFQNVISFASLILSPHVLDLSTDVSNVLATPFTLVPRVRNGEGIRLPWKSFGPASDRSYKNWQVIPMILTSFHILLDFLFKQKFVIVLAVAVNMQHTDDSDTTFQN